MTCSKGTYIRALARDLGQEVGTNAYLAGLTRTRSGQFRVEDSVDLDMIRSAGRDGFLDRSSIRLTPPWRIGGGSFGRG